MYFMSTVTYLTHYVYLRSCQKKLLTEGNLKSYLFVLGEQSFQARYNKRLLKVLYPCHNVQQCTYFCVKLCAQKIYLLCDSMFHFTLICQMVTYWRNVGLRCTMLHKLIQMYFFFLTKKRANNCVNPRTTKNSY